MLIQMMLIHGIDELPLELSTGIELGSKFRFDSLLADEGNLMASVQSKYLSSYPLSLS